MKVTSAAEAYLARSDRRHTFLGFLNNVPDVAPGDGVHSRCWLILHQHTAHLNE
jgi:hypothetical protein